MNRNLPLAAVNLPRFNSLHCFLLYIRWNTAGKYSPFDLLLAMLDEG
jgi:hypothetical protein